MKILRLPQSTPKNVGSKRAQSKKYRDLEKQGQLNLFTNGKIIYLNNKTAFEEALKLDEQGQRQAAEKLYLKSIEQGRDIADSYCNLGIIVSEQENYPRAVDYFTRCLAEDHRHYQGHFNLANTYAEAGNLKLACFHYQISINIVPTFSSSYFNLGLTFVKMGKYSRALEVFSNFLGVASPEDHTMVNDMMIRLREMIADD